MTRTVTKDSRPFIVRYTHGKGQPKDGILEVKSMKYKIVKTKYMEYSLSKMTTMNSLDHVVRFMTTAMVIS